MWDLIVTVPDHCLPFYFVQREKNEERLKKKKKKKYVQRGARPRD